MRKLIKNRRGDISAPIITILLVIASISIAALVISWLFGVGISTSKQANIIIVGTPTLQIQGNGATLYITLKNVGNTPATITAIIIQSQPATVTSVNGVNHGLPLTINATQTVSLIATLSLTNTNTNTSSFNGIIQSSAGTIPFIAVIQSSQ